ncbi:MAG TPA: hypothetical protein PKD26_07665 [Pyrinomonadaceae bacterium]|nr:hypothetical protein [Pyrinomonadaceae bacterium]
MKEILVTFVVIAFSACFPTCAVAQAFSEIRKKAVGMVEAKYPESGVRIRELTLKREEDKQAFYNWRIIQNGKQDWIVLKIFYGGSIEEAVKFMEVSNSNIQVGPGLKRRDLGDEAYFFEDARTEFARIRFRKANVYLDIQASSLAEAEELARNIDKFIKKRRR